MLQPGRSYSAGNQYRYGFQTQEKSSEIYESSYTAEFWQYDSRIGRRWNVDPVLKEYESSYLSFGGNPIWVSDFDGADTTKFPESQIKPMLKYFAENAKVKQSGAGVDYDDCIECHNKAMKTILENSQTKTGSTASETRTEMQKAGSAGETKIFGFNDANGNTALATPQASKLKESIGKYVSDKTDGVKQLEEFTVFGVSIMDGYHTMTLTATQVKILGTTFDIFILSDQGTNYGTEKKGNIVFLSAKQLDKHLTKYVKKNNDARIKGKYFYPAKIELHQIFNKTE